MHRIRLRARLLGVFFSLRRRLVSVIVSRTYKILYVLTRIPSRGLYYNGTRARDFRRAIAKSRHVITRFNNSRNVRYRGLVSATHSEPT